MILTIFLKQYLYYGTALDQFALNIMSATPNGVETSPAPSIKAQHLSYAFPDGSSGLQDVILDLPPGSRTLLIGGELLPLLPFFLASVLRARKPS
jgi:hypothetical protein